MHLEPECVYMPSRFSTIGLFVTPWTVAHSVPLSMGYFRQEYWSLLPCPCPWDFPHPGIKPTSLISPALAGELFTTKCHLNVNPGFITSICVYWHELLTFEIHFY